MILHAMASTTKIERLKYSIFFVEAIALQGDTSFRKRFFFKMASVKLETVTSSIKDFHVC